MASTRLLLLMAMEADKAKRAQFEEFSGGQAMAQLQEEHFDIVQRPLLLSTTQLQHMHLLQPVRFSFVHQAGGQYIKTEGVVVNTYSSVGQFKDNIIKVFNISQLKVAAIRDICKTGLLHAKKGHQLQNSNPRLQNKCTITTPINLTCLTSFRS